MVRTFAVAEKMGYASPTATARAPSCACCSPKMNAGCVMSSTPAMQSGMVTAVADEMRSPSSRTRPPRMRDAASERVLTIRANQSHLSILWRAVAVSGASVRTWPSTP